MNTNRPPIPTLGAESTASPLRPARGERNGCSTGAAAQIPSALLTTVPASILPPKADMINNPPGPERPLVARNWESDPYSYPARPADRRKLKTKAKREAILRSAARAFSRRGYHATSMDDIAGQLLMTKGALYYYFRDKEDILFACHDYSLSLVLENLAAVEALDAPASKKLELLIVAHVHVMLDALQGSAMALDFNALSPELFNMIVEKRDAFERGMRRLIDQGVADGEFRPCDSKMVSFMVLGSINWITKWFKEGGSYDGESIGREYAAAFIRSLRPDVALAPTAGEASSHARPKQGASEPTAPKPKATRSAARPRKTR